MKNLILFTLGVIVASSIFMGVQATSTTDTKPTPEPTPTEEPEKW